MANNQFAMALSQINRILTRKTKKKSIPTLSVQCYLTYIQCTYALFLWLKCLP